MKLRNALVIALSIAVTIPLVANANDVSSWTNRPTWAADRDSNSAAASRPRRASGTSTSSQDSRTNVHPFSPGSHNVAIDLGQVFLMGKTGSMYSDSIGAQLHYTYGVSDMFAFDSSFGFSSHSDGAYSQTCLLAGMRTNLAWYDKVVPYLNFGMGFYKPSYEFTSKSGAGTAQKTLIETAAPVLFGLHMGPGVDLELTQSLFFGASLTFHDMFGTKKLVSSTVGEQDLGGSYTSFYLRAGVTF